MTAEVRNAVVDAMYARDFDAIARLGFSVEAAKRIIEWSERRNVR